MLPYYFLFTLALLGLYMCWPFAHSFIFPNKPAFHDLICKDGSCTRLSKTPYAHLLGLPNWMYGIAFYVLLIILAIIHNPALYVIALAGATASIALGFILVWALVVKLKFFCAYCYIAHAVNVTILVLLVSLYHLY